jgi:hypothetical protein
MQGLAQFIVMVALLCAQPGLLTHGEVCRLYQVDIGPTAKHTKHHNKYTQLLLHSAYRYTPHIITGSNLSLLPSTIYLRAILCVSHCVIDAPIHPDRPPGRRLVGVVVGQYSLDSAASPEPPNEGPAPGLVPTIIALDHDVDDVLVVHQRRLENEKSALCINYSTAHTALEHMAYPYHKQHGRHRNGLI